MSKPKKKPPAPVPANEPEKGSSIKSAFLGWYGVIGMTLGYVSPIKLPWAEGYAKEHWRQALGSLLVVLMLLASAVGLALYLLDVNDFKDQIVSYVKTHKQRDLVLEGDIHVTWFPKLGLDTGKMSLSQRNSSRKFASVDNARLYVAWWPLFSKEVKVERIVLDGLHANLLRHPDGSTNFDDLLTPADWMGEVRFAIDKVRVTDSSLNFHDEGSGTALFAHELKLETGHLADGMAGEVKTSLRLQSAKPQLDLQLQLGGHMLYEHAQQRYELANFEGQARGEAGGFNELLVEVRGTLGVQPEAQQLTLDKFSSTFKGRREGQNVEARLSAANLKRDKQQWRASGVSAGATLQREQELLSASLELPAVEADDQSVRSPNLQLAVDLFPGEASLQGKFASPASFNRETREFQLNALQGSWSGAHPLLAGKLNGSASGALQVNWPAQDLKLDFKTRIDESEFSGGLQAQDWSTPAYTFDLSANTLDLDRYLVSDWQQRLPAADQALDFSVLKNLNVKVKLRSEELRVARIKVSQFAAELRAASGALSVDSMQARLYGGNLQGSMSLRGGETAQMELRHKLTGVQLDALLADVLNGEARLSGKGNLAVELSAQGNTALALRQSLSGAASVALSRGSVAGLNLAEALVAGKEQIGIEGAAHADNVRLTESTAFNELQLTLDFAQGQARSSDIVLKSPVLSCRGEGRVALEGGQLEARLQALVAPGLKRSVAGELAELSGITVPLRVSGPWQSAALRYELAAATGANLARLVKANEARQSAQAATPAVSASAATTSKADAKKTSGKP